MAKPLLTEELWQIVEPLLPAPKPRRFKYPGRKPADPRKVLNAILFILKTGIPWEDLPLQMGCSGMTAWRYLHDWQALGVWDNIHRALLDRLNEADKIDWSRAIVDSGSVRAVHGGKKRVPIPRIAVKRGPSIT